MTKDEIGNQYVVFGYRSFERTVNHLGSYPTTADAKLVVLENSDGKGKNLQHIGIAKVQHPQQIWFYKKGVFIPVNRSLVLDIITLLGI